MISDTVAFKIHTRSTELSNFSALFPPTFWFHVSLCKQISSMWLVEVATHQPQFLKSTPTAHVEKKVTLIFISQVLGNSQIGLSLVNQSSLNKPWCLRQSMTW